MKSLIFCVALGALAVYVGTFLEPGASAAGHGAGQIAFVRGQLFPGDAYLHDAHIYTVNSDGSSLRQITGLAQSGAADSNELAPAWSPDGRKIAFIRYSIVAQPSYSLWVMNANGSNERRLADDLTGSAPCVQDNMLAGCAMAVSASWAPDGKQIAFARWSGPASGGRFHLWLMRTDGARPRQLTHGANELHPSWSPDGRRIAFFRATAFNDRGEIWVLDRRTGRARPVGQVPSVSCDGCPASSSSWSPSGRWIAFFGAGGLQEVNLVSHQRHKLGQGLEPAWAPTGNELAFASPGDSDGQYRIAILNRGTATQITHVSYPTDDEYPAWRPRSSR